VTRDLLKALEYAGDAGRMQRLVYNVSVLYWRVCRNLMQDGKWQGLLPSIEQVVGALEKAETNDYYWLVRLRFALAKAKLESGLEQDAERIVKATYTILSGKDPLTTEAAARLQLTMELKVELLGKIKFDNPALETLIKVRLGKGAAATKPQEYANTLLECHARLLGCKGVKNDEDMKRVDWDNVVDGR
jgi:hypothetical protein